MLSVTNKLFVLSVIMLNVIMLFVIMLNVVAPRYFVFLYNMCISGKNLSPIRSKKSALSLQMFFFVFFYPPTKLVNVMKGVIQCFQASL